MKEKRLVDFKIHNPNIEKKQKISINIFTKIMIIPILLCLICFNNCLVSCQTIEDTSNRVKKEILHEETKMQKNDDMYYTINMKDIFTKQIELNTSKNLIVIHVQNEIVESGNSTFDNLIDVSVNVESQGFKESDVDIRDVIIKNSESKDIILHYIVYDLCNLDLTSKINLKIEALDGKFIGFISAEIIDLSPFSIECIDKQSETFIPREQHAACETWDGTVWVFGGKRNEKKDEILMNDLMSFDSK